MTPDSELLKRYAGQRDEAAFAELVRRHLDHVYSTALRLVGGDGHLAEDVAQTAFSELARKAGSLRDCVAVSGWLHTSARFAAAKVVRGEQRRRQREQAVLAMPQTSTASDPDWEQVRCLLDETIGELSDVDRDALMLRYFENKPYGEVGVALGLTENAARMRVDRAIDKLRTRLLLHGVTSTAAALSTALAQHVVGTAPAALGARITARALATGSGAGGGPESNSLGPASKVALGTVALLIVATVGLRLGSKLPAGKPEAINGVTGGGAQAAAQQASRNAGAPLTQKTMHAEPPVHPGLELFFVDDQTGLPITNQVAALRGWERGAQLLVERVVPLEQGRCVAPFEPSARPTHGYWILTHIEGYADVRLRWYPGRGEVIPEFYTIRLVRPVLIHGQVVDPDGKPVAGATVGFNTENMNAEGGSPEDHCVDYLRARTDSEGRWRIYCLAPEMVGRVFGSASHPEYSRSEMIYASRPPEIAQQLRDGTLVFRLGEGITVSGRVVNGSGQPITGAEVRVGNLGTSSTRDALTGADGSFRVTGCQPGPGLVSALADGSAPAAISLTLTSNIQPLQLVLGPGKPLRVRVSDPSGLPVAGATLSLDAFPRSERSTPIPQFYFSAQTDAEGCVVWTNTPEQELVFGVGAPGYIHAGLTVYPDGQEHLVTLSPALVISGTVRDSVTGELIPRFRIGIGWPDKAADGSEKAQWIDIDRFWPSFSGGEFRHSLEEPVVGIVPNPGYVFRFEAEGHTPLVTRVYYANEGEVRLDVQLRPVEDVAAMAYTPEGRIARDAQIGLLAPGREVRLVPGGFAGSLGHALASIRRVDADGRFTVPGDGSIERVVIAHATGYAEATLDELRKARAVRLRPWARIEGRWQAGGQPIANGEIDLGWGRRSGIVPDLEPGAFRARTDANGHFVFSQAPPGSLQLFGRSTRAGIGTPGQSEKLAEVEARPGETSEVSAGQ